MRAVTFLLILSSLLMLSSARAEEEKKSALEAHCDSLLSFVKRADPKKAIEELTQATQKRAQEASAGMGNLTSGLGIATGGAFILAKEAWKNEQDQMLLLAMAPACPALASVAAFRAVETLVNGAFGTSALLVGSVQAYTGAVQVSQALGVTSTVQSAWSLACAGCDWLSLTARHWVQGTHPYQAAWETLRLQKQGALYAENQQQWVREFLMKQKFDHSRFQYAIRMDEDLRFIQSAEFQPLLVSWLKEAGAKTPRDVLAFSSAWARGMGIPEKAELLEALTAKIDAVEERASEDRKTQEFWEAWSALSERDSDLEPEGMDTYKKRLFLIHATAELPQLIAHEDFLLRFEGAFSWKRIRKSLGDLFRLE